MPRRGRVRQRDDAEGAEISPDGNDAAQQPGDNAAGRKDQERSDPGASNTQATARNYAASSSGRESALDPPNDTDDRPNDGDNEDANEDESGMAS
jgi:hypothetical protein